MNEVASGLWRRAVPALRPTRRRLAGVLAVVLVAVFGVAGLARVDVETGVESFLPSSDPSVQRYSELAASFGGDPLVVLLRSDERSALLQRDAIGQLLGAEGELSRLPDVASVYGPATTLNQLSAQAQRLLAELTGRRDGLRTFAANEARAQGASEAAAAAAGERAVADFDQRYGPLIVQGLPVGLPTLRNQRFIDNVLYNPSGEPRPQWRYVVPDDHSVAILIRPREGLSQDATERLVAAVRETVDGAVAQGMPAADVTVSGVPGIVAALGQAVDREIPLIGGIAVGAIALCLFLVPWTARRRRLAPLAVTLAATALTVAVLGWLGRPVSLGVVAFLPVLIGLGTFYPTYFARGARPRTVLVVAGGTTAGFATLAFSPLPFVRDLGLTLAIGIVFAVALGWLAFRRADPAPASPAAVARPRPSRRARIGATVAAGAIALGGWATLPFLTLQTSIDDLTSGLPAVADANRVEEVLGSGGELSVVLTADDGHSVLSPEAWAWMNEAQQTVVRSHGDEARPALSATGMLGFLGTEPTQEQIDAGIRLLPPYLTNAVVRGDARVSTMSFGVRLDDLDRLRDLTTALNAELPAPPPGYRVELSGLPTVAVQGYDLVSADRYLASLAGLVAAGAVLFAGLRRRSDATRAVAAAVLATGTELLLLWASGTPLNPLTVALGSLTAAVGCEFTVMMCDAARHGDKRLRTAVTLAALTAGAGFAVLAVSQLAVMREFGLLLAGSVLLSALAARLVVAVHPPLPASRPDDAGPDASSDTPPLVGVSP
ncbi:MMPL family transporter [Pseudonocardia sp. RS11V-5]|uniref:MMPL family transporter n=1 Tax=Pseudonocardia terrae TaxID=2905831 RepID=UPI001E4375F7|nr:MMPL family transporter [Pseudonocardia terrae]MCE3552858.1 MMPL family transporter [Pseudonocardia terrae]